MDFNIIKVKGFNTLIYLLMGLQIAMLIGVAAILFYAVNDVGVLTTISTTVMFLLGLPLIVLLYISSTDKTLRTVFLGLMANIAIVSIAGIIWYILSDPIGAGWPITLAKVLMVIAYAPLIYSLYKIYKADNGKLDRYAKAFITFVNLSCSFTIIFFALIHLSTGNISDIIVYTLATIGDVIILALGAQLIIIYSPTRLRYIFSIVFCFILLSFAGDALNLVGAMHEEAFGLPGYAHYFYDAMLLFLAVALLVYSFLKDIGAVTVEEVNKKLGDTRHAMDDLIMQMPDAACIFDPDGKAIMVNDPFLGIFGVEQQHLIGSFNIFQHIGRLQSELRDKIALLKKGETVVLEQRKILFPDNRVVYLSFKIFPTFSQDGAISSYITIVEDVTERVHSEEELIQAKTLVELYIDLMGHDINNMNQIGMGYLELAMDTLSIGEENKKLLEKPREAMENSSRLIENVKKLRRANTEGLALQRVDLGKVLMDVIENHAQAPGRDIAIEHTVAENTFVNANELLKDVFVNLVNNSIKHSIGSLKLTIREEPVEVIGKKYYQVTIEDNGPGIPEGLKPIIFDRILRGRNKVGGNGIGLYLVKTLVDNYGGTITVEDRMPGERQKGSRFVVTLPAADQIPNTQRSSAPVGSDFIR